MGILKFRRYKVWPSLLLPVRIFDNARISFVWDDFDHYGLASVADLRELVFTCYYKESMNHSTGIKKEDTCPPFSFAIQKMLSDHLRQPGINTGPHF